MTSADSDPWTHPLARTPAAAMLFSRLITLMEALGKPMAFARGGDGCVSVPVWREVRTAIRQVEGLFRRLLLLPAIALADQLPAQRRRAAPPITPLAKPDRPADTTCQSRQQPLPWCPVRFHETGQGRDHASDWRVRPAPLGDGFGTCLMSLRPAYHRYCALVCAIEFPEMPILRLARILRRRQSSRRAGRHVDHVPFPLGWGTESDPVLARLLRPWRAVPEPVPVGGASP